MITQLVGKGDALKDGKETGQEVLKRAGQAAVVGTMAGGAALAVGKMGVGAARSVAGTISNSKTAQALQEKAGRGVNALRTRAGNFAGRVSDRWDASRVGQWTDRQATRASEWGGRRRAGLSNRVTNAKNFLEDEVLTNPKVQGVLSGTRTTAHYGKQAIKGAVAGAKNIRNDLKDNMDPKSIAETKDAIQNLFGGIVKTTGVHKQIEDLVGADAMPFEKGFSKYYRAFTGEKVGSAKKDDEKAKAKQAQEAQASEVQKAMQKDLKDMTRDIVDALKNLNVNTVTITGVGDSPLSGVGASTPGEVGYYPEGTYSTNTSAQSQTPGRTQVEGQVDVNSDAIVNAVNEVKNAINTTDANIRSKLNALTIGMGMVSEAIRTTASETQKAVKDVENATTRVKDAVNDQNEKK